MAVASPRSIQLPPGRAMPGGWAPGDGGTCPVGPGLVAADPVPAEAAVVAGAPPAAGAVAVAVGAAVAGGHGAVLAGAPGAWLVVPGLGAAGDAGGAGGGCWPVRRPGGDAAQHGRGQALQRPG